MTRLFLLFAIFISSSTFSQECKTCPKPTIIQFFDFDWFNIPRPEDTSMLRQWDKLGMLTAEIDEQLDLHMAKDGNCIMLMRAGNHKQPSSGEFRQLGTAGYSMYGTIYKSAGDYQLNLWLQPVCGSQKLAETEVRFQLYPELDLDKLVNIVVSLFTSKLDIAEWELQERKKKDLPVTNKGNIIVDVHNFALKPGQETGVSFVLRDCDGTPLKDKTITFEGTKGGTISPVSVKTNSGGYAEAKFKLSSSNGAYIIAHCATKTVTGCDARFVGSESLVPGLVKVEIEYEEMQESATDWKKANPFAALKASGGEEFEHTRISYNSIFYHKPSAQARKNKYLVYDEKTEIENYGSVSHYWHEYGVASYTRNIAPGQVGVEVGEFKVGEDEQGSTFLCSGNAPERAAQVILMLGDAQNPALFDLAIEFPMSNDCVASGGMFVQKGDPAHTFISKRITDPKIPYKTEYTIVALQDLHKGFVEGQKSLGMDLKGAGNLTGYRFVKVRILSPY